MLTRTGLGVLIGTVVCAFFGLVWQLRGAARPRRGRRNRRGLGAVHVAAADSTRRAAATDHRPGRPWRDRSRSLPDLQPDPAPPRVDPPHRRVPGCASVVRRADAAADDAVTKSMPSSPLAVGASSRSGRCRSNAPINWAWPAASRPIGQMGTVVVHPRVYPLITASGAVRVITNDAVLRRPSGDPQSGFQSLREYQYGDDTRLIHWPTSARAATLMVREFVDLRRHEFTVVIDTSTEVATRRRLRRDRRRRRQRRRVRPAFGARRGRAHDVATACRSPVSAGRPVRDARPADPARSRAAAPTCCRSPACSPAGSVVSPCWWSPARKDRRRSSPMATRSASPGSGSAPRPPGSRARQSPPTTPASSPNGGRSGTEDRPRHDQRPAVRSCPRGARVRHRVWPSAAARVVGTRFEPILLIPAALAVLVGWLLARLHVRRPRPRRRWSRSWHRECASPTSVGWHGRRLRPRSARRAAPGRHHGVAQPAVPDDLRRPCRADLRRHARSSIDLAMRAALAGPADRSDGRRDGRPDRRGCTRRAAVAGRAVRRRCVVRAAVDRPR